MFHWVICRPLKYWNFQSKPKVEQIIAIITTRSVSCLFCFEFFLLLWVFSFILLRVFDFVVIFLLLLSVFAFVVSFQFYFLASYLCCCDFFYRYVHSIYLVGHGTMIDIFNTTLMRVDIVRYGDKSLRYGNHHLKKRNQLLTLMNLTLWI